MYGRTKFVKRLTTLRFFVEGATVEEEEKEAERVDLRRGLFAASVEGILSRDLPWRVRIGRKAGYAGQRVGRSYAGR
jgi:hypothetical protein